MARRRRSCAVAWPGSVAGSPARFAAVRESRYSAERGFAGHDCELQRIVYVIALIPGVRRYSFDGPSGRPQCATRRPFVGRAVDVVVSGATLGGLCPVGTRMGPHVRPRWHGTPASDAAKALSTVSIGLTVRGRSSTVGPPVGMTACPG